MLSKKGALSSWHPLLFVEDMANASHAAVELFNEETAEPPQPMPPGNSGVYIGVFFVFFYIYFIIMIRNLTQGIYLKSVLNV